MGEYNERQKSILPFPHLYPLCFGHLEHAPTLPDTHPQFSIPLCTHHPSTTRDPLTVPECWTTHNARGDSDLAKNESLYQSPFRPLALDSTSGVRRGTATGHYSGESVAFVNFLNGSEQSCLTRGNLSRIASHTLSILFHPSLFQA